MIIISLIDATAGLLSIFLFPAPSQPANAVSLYSQDLKNRIRTTKQGTHTCLVEGNHENNRVDILLEPIYQGDIVVTLRRHYRGILCYAAISV